MAKYKHADVDQYQMISLNLGELFEEGHPTRRLLEIIDKLDLSIFDKNYTNDNGKGGRLRLSRESSFGNSFLLAITRQYFHA